MVSTRSRPVSSTNWFYVATILLALINLPCTVVATDVALAAERDLPPQAATQAGIQAGILRQEKQAARSALSRPHRQR